MILVTGAAGNIGGKKGLLQIGERTFANDAVDLRGA